MDSPAPDEGFRRVAFDLDDGVMAGIAFGDPNRPPDILFLHATGFNARSYRVLLAPLAERFHVVAVDVRGHGRTTLQAKLFGYDSWRRHRDDIIALLTRHFTQPVTMAGHSMGATVSLLAAGARPDLIAGIALIDPVLLSKTQRAMVSLPGGTYIGRMQWPVARKAGARRRSFASYEAAAALLGKRGVFKSFEPQSVADYVADGFVDDGAGGVRLSCAPAYEAATFVAQRNDPWSALKRVSGPIVMLRAEQGSTTAEPVAQRFAALRPDARIATVAGASHMLPFERPDRVRAAIEAAAVMAASTRPFRDLV